METNTEEILCAEIGRFVIEFEGLLQNTKDTIQNLFKEENLDDTIPVEILMYDSTSAPIAKYFEAISLHYLNTKHSNKKPADIKKLKKIINIISTQLLKAGELRNDVVHASWYLSSIYGTNAKLEANRIKVTANGLVMRKLFIQPNILSNTIRMINSLSYFIQSVGDVIADKQLRLDFFDFNITDINNINFEKEKKKLFSDDLQHYENIMRYKKEFDALEKDNKDAKINAQK